MGNIIFVKILPRARDKICTDNVTHIKIYNKLTPSINYFLNLQSDNKHNWRDIYNIGALTVNIECMWRGLETGKRRALANLSIRFVPSHIIHQYCIYSTIQFTLKTVI
jgi:hypothetical protein